MGSGITKTRFENPAKIKVFLVNLRLSRYRIFGAGLDLRKPKELDGEDGCYSEDDVRPEDFHRWREWYGYEEPAPRPKPRAPPKIIPPKPVKAPDYYIGEHYEPER